MYHETCKDNEVFVGNTKADNDLAALKKIGVKCRLGSIAYDIHGKVISSELMLPLFVEKDSLDRYDRFMMDSMKK